jgi:hypothetical protein
MRLAEFDTLFRTVVQRATRTRLTYLELVISPESEASGRDLASRETNCRSFFQFGFEPTTKGALLIVGCAAAGHRFDRLCARGRL